MVSLANVDRFITGALAEGLKGKTEDVQIVLRSTHFLMLKGNCVKNFNYRVSNVKGCSVVIAKAVLSNKEKTDKNYYQPLLRRGGL